MLGRGSATTAGGAGVSQAALAAGCPENVGLPSGEIGRRPNMVFGIGALGVCKLHTHFGAVTSTRMYQHLISPLGFVCFFLCYFH